MLLSIRHLFAYVWANLVAALGTTTLSILLFSFAIPIAIFIATAALTWHKERKLGWSVKGIVKGSLLSWQTGIATAVYLLAWVGLVSWSLLDTTHKDHNALLGRIHVLVNDNKSLKSQNDVLKAENDHLKSLPPIMRTLSVEPEKKCWTSHHFGMPNSTVPGSVTTTAVILRCNYKIEAPFQIAVQFDRDFIPGAVVLPDAGGWMGGGEMKVDQTIVAQINNPSLLANELVIVTVYGKTDQYPRVLRAGMKALN